MDQACLPSRANSAHVLRVPGRVGVDEERLHRVVAEVDGWIRDLGPNPRGALVREGDVLASYYTPYLISSEQSLISSRDDGEGGWRGVPGNGADRPWATFSLQDAMDALRCLGMDGRQIEELRRTKAAIHTIRIYSPVTALVLERNVSRGQRFEKGSELYRLADLSRLWVTVEVAERHLELVRPEEPATVYWQGGQRQARRINGLPREASDSGAFNVRFEMDNPDFTLRPEMLVDVELPAILP